MAFVKCPKCGSVSTVELDDRIQEGELTEDDDIPELMCLTCFDESLDEKHLDIWGPLIQTVVSLVVIIALLFVVGFASRAIYGR